jgi:acyl-coenzyme A synthetase/AMP-(fatty) acid ligase
MKPKGADHDEANLQVEHSKAIGAYFDITPYERPDGTVDEAWIDAFLEHSFRRGAERMKRL